MSGGATTATSRAITPESNVKPFDDIMLGISGAEEGTAGGIHAGVPIPIENVHPFPTGEAIGRGLGAAGCAARLAQELRSVGLPAVDGWPAFDLVLLGVGGDGHILSVFPGSPALDAKELALAIPAPTHIGPHLERVTLNPAVVGAAARVLVVVSGADKAATIASIFGSERDPRRWPAQLAPPCRRDLDPRRGGRRRVAGSLMSGGPRSGRSGRPPSRTSRSAELTRRTVRRWAMSGSRPGAPPSTSRPATLTMTSGPGWRTS